MPSERSDVGMLALRKSMPSMWRPTPHCAVSAHNTAKQNHSAVFAFSRYAVRTCSTVAALPLTRPFGPEIMLHRRTESAELNEDIATVAVAQLARASDCGSEGRGFKPLQPPWPRPRLTRARSGLSFLSYGRTNIEHCGRCAAKPHASTRGGTNGRWRTKHHSNLWPAPSTQCAHSIGSFCRLRPIAYNSVSGLVCPSADWF